jgi:hypothetical protein
MTGQIHCCEWRNKGQTVQKWPTAIIVLIQYALVDDFGSLLVPLILDN